MGLVEGDAAGVRTLAYVVNGYPRRSELFIASEMRRLEEHGIRLRPFVIKPGDPGEPHPVVREITAPVTYLPRWAPTPGTTMSEWLVRNAPPFLPALARATRRRPGGVARAMEFSREQAARARRLSGDSSPLPQIKELLLAVALADRVLSTPDVVHLHAAFAHRPATVAWMASMITGMPFSFTGHAKDIYVPDLNPAGLLGRKLAAASFAVTCTQANRRHLLAMAPGAEVHTVYHGLNTDFARLVEVAVAPASPGRDRDGNRLRVLGAGRHVPKKGFDLLIEACALLRDDGHDVQLRILGGRGEATEALRSLIDARGLQDRACLAGPCSQEELLAELRAADLFCLPCRVLENGDRDGIPNVLVEAMAAGVAVITTAVSGIPELVDDGVNGRLVPPDSASALAAAAAALHRNRPLARRLGAAGQATVGDRFDGDRQAETLAALFQGALG